MSRRPPVFTRTDPRLPYTTLFRSEALTTETGLTWATTPAGASLLHDLVKPTDKGRNAAGHARPDEQWQEAQIIDDLHRCKSGIAQVRVLATHPSYILENQTTISFWGDKRA